MYKPQWSHGLTFAKIRKSELKNKKKVRFNILRQTLTIFRGGVTRFSRKLCTFACIHYSLTANQMAKCLKCGKRIPRRVIRCPYCGGFSRSSPGEFTRLLHDILWASIFFGFIILILWLISVFGTAKWHTILLSLGSRASGCFTFINFVDNPHSWQWYWKRH